MNLCGKAQQDHEVEELSIPHRRNLRDFLPRGLSAVASDDRSDTALILAGETGHLHVGQQVGAVFVVAAGLLLHQKNADMFSTIVQIRAGPCHYCFKQGRRFQR